MTLPLQDAFSQRPQGDSYSVMLRQTVFANQVHLMQNDATTQHLSSCIDLPGGGGMSLIWKALMMVS